MKKKKEQGDPWSKASQKGFPLFSISVSQTLDLELRDLEAEVKRASAAAEQVLKQQQEDVPPQLLLALEKDRQSLARGYEAARALSAGVLQSLKDHKESRKVRITIKSWAAE